MTQHAMTLNNQAGASFRADLNNALVALVSNNTGAGAPAVTFANMFYMDTSANKFKKRNAANSAWIIIGDIDAVGFGLLSLAGDNMTGAINEAVFSVAAHATTADLFTGGNFGTLTGAVVTFTNLAAAPVAGAWRWIRSNAAHVLTSNANILVHGGTQTIADGTLMLWHAITTTTFEVWIWVEETGLTDYSATSTIVGWSSFTTKEISTKKIGTNVFVQFRIAGTSNSAAATFTLPYTNGPLLSGGSCDGLDSTSTIVPAMVQIAASSATITAYPSILAGSWTASGTKVIYGQLWYVTA